MTNELPGGSTPSQYGLPPNATELQDLIEHRGMNFAVGNIFKAAYRLGRCSHSDQARDLRKIIWFAERELARVEKAERDSELIVDDPRLAMPASFRHPGPTGVDPNEAQEGYASIDAAKAQTTVANSAARAIISQLDEARQAAIEAAKAKATESIREAAGVFHGLGAKVGLSSAPTTGVGPNKPAARVTNAATVVLETPCPFCGSRDCVVTRFPKQVRCRDCGSEGPETTGSIDDAIRLWVKRSPAPAPGQVDPNEAPDGYMAAPGVGNADDCTRCWFGDSACTSVSCNPGGRRDGRSVYFVRKEPK